MHRETPEDQMDDREVGRYWDENAPEWIRAVRAGWDKYREQLNNPAFFGMLPDLRGKRVLDIGCGEGYNTRKSADLGASVVGIDISEAMIAAARRHEAEHARGIEYHLASGSDLGMFGDATFDAVLSTMAMMDLPDYAGCVRECFRVLQPGGLFQFSVTHPCTQTRLWKWVRDDKGERIGVIVGNYFGLQPETPEEDVDEWFFGAAPAEVKATARKFRIPRFFRTLGEYYNTLVDAGFSVERLCEPVADEETARKHPYVADTRIVPYTLIFQCRKGPATPRPPTTVGG